jgi:hypothetical protein
MSDEGTPKKAAEAGAKQRKRTIRKRARELASEEGKEWATVPKEERKGFRKAARKATRGDLSSVLRKVSETTTEPKEDSSTSSADLSTQGPPSGPMPTNPGPKRRRPTS